MNGMINVLKPPGMTSHDVVYVIRKITGGKKAGHTGTLDPGAAGVLPVCIGKATRIVEFLPDDKRYRAEITFGRATSTQDAFGEVISERGAENITAGKVQACLPGFLGAIEQVPPMTSAVRHHGKRLYQLARAGVEVERKPRTVHIYELQMVDFRHEPPGRPAAILDIRCSAGTYIRTLGHDLGQVLGCGAYMSFLLRTRAGLFTLEKSSTLEELEHKRESGALADVITTAEKALAHMPGVCVAGPAVAAVSSGNRLILPVSAVDKEVSSHQVIRIQGPGGLMALATVNPVAGKPQYRMFQPVKVLV